MKKILLIAPKYLSEIIVLPPGFYLVLPDDLVFYLANVKYIRKNK